MRKYRDKLRDASRRSGDLSLSSKDRSAAQEEVKRLAPAASAEEVHEKIANATSPNKE